VPEPVVTVEDQGGLPAATGMPQAEAEADADAEPPSTVGLPALAAAVEDAAAGIPVELPIVPLAPTQIPVPDIQLPQLPAAIALP
jgi:hypothetical protein